MAIIHKGELLLESSREELLNKYPVNTAELELDNHGQANGTWTEVLQQQSWVNSIQAENNVVRVTVKDLASGKQALLPLVAGLGLIINRIQWVHPTLEEIFLEVSS